MNPELRLALVTSALMCTMMDAVLSGFFAAVNVGLNAQWWSHWLKACAMAWPVAFITVMLVSRPARQLAVWLCR